VSVRAIVGAHWGDEGKGKVVDYLAAEADLVIRYNGGSNAGHTVVPDERGEFRLHLVPCGIFRPDVDCLVGPGTVVDPEALLAEIAELERRGVCTARLYIAERAHLLLPHHTQRDGLEEDARGTRQQGTTRRGIGPAYTDKVARVGLQVGDLLDASYLRSYVPLLVEYENRVLQAYGAGPLDAPALLQQCLAWAEHLRERIVDSHALVPAALREGRAILLEGQLGVMRDLDWGIYPYVTSSCTLAGGAAAGAGIPPHRIQQVTGVTKAYTTAVGAGPLPTELHGEAAAGLRALGKEYGASTGRPRRCGWFDAVAGRFAAELNGFTDLAVMKLDVLDSFERVRICTAYRLGGQILSSMPTTTRLAAVEPVYEDLPGWQCCTGSVRRFEELPKAAQAFIHRIEAAVGVPVRLIGVGPQRLATIAR
jgi:adenylosuccinate synthase